MPNSLFQIRSSLDGFPFATARTSHHIKSAFPYGKAPACLLPITIIPYLKQNGVPLSCHNRAIFLILDTILKFLTLIG